MTTEERAFEAAWKACSSWDGKITKPVLRKAIEAYIKEIDGEPVAIIWMLRKLIDNPAFYTQTSGGGTRPKVEITFDDLEGMRRFSDALAECRLYLRDHGGDK